MDQWEPILRVAVFSGGGNPAASNIGDVSWAKDNKVKVVSKVVSKEANKVNAARASKAANKVVSKVVSKVVRRAVPASNRVRWTRRNAKADRLDQRNRI